MAIATEITLENTGCPVVLPVYVCLQNIQVLQVRDKNTQRAFWTSRANVAAFASREAKHAGKMPLEVSNIECELVAGADVFASLYTALKQVPRFANATDV